jgi:beta-glucosidase
MFLEYTKKQQDFIGVNFYFHEKIWIKNKWPLVDNRNDNEVVSDLGWDIYPRGIYEVLKKMKKYDLPIYITENGVADEKDRLRTTFIKDHLKWIHKAIKEGADVRGYLYWSLLDDFEWEHGFEPRFGLVEMDFEDLSYKIRPSALEYAKICKDNKLIIEN